MIWNLLLDTARPGWANMAIDLAVLELARQHREGWLRLYAWEPYCLSFGRHEPARRRYAADRVRALGVDVVRRPTGGRAVWHARELTYAVAAPADALGSLVEAYLRIHAVLASALRSLGAEAVLAPTPAQTPGVDAGACFSRPVGGEVMVGGRKVIGSAQLRQDGGVLQHGSMLLEDDQSMLRTLAGDPGSVDLAAPLAALLGRRVPRQEAAAAVIAAAGAEWSGNWTEVGNLEPVLDRAACHYDRLRSEEWTWQR